MLKLDSFGSFFCCTHCIEDRVVELVVEENMFTHILIFFHDDFKIVAKFRMIGVSHSSVISF